ncbi:TPA: hypothetical protein ACN30M_004596 [Vibrio parahaemolyticus]
MTSEELKRTLQTIGMTCFVQHFYDLINDNNTISDLVEIIANDNVSESSARTKAYAGRKIIKNNMQLEALKRIANAPIVDSQISDKAASILGKQLTDSDHSDISQTNKPSPLSGSIWNNKVTYSELNARQQENYNMLKLGAVLADFGFDLIRLNDDWQGADAIGNHRDGSYIKIQLKGRLTIDRKYLEKDIYIAFRDNDVWYLYPHDELVEVLTIAGIATTTQSWIEKGHYSWPQISSQLNSILNQYRLS